MPVDHSAMKLGKLEFKHDRRTLMLANYQTRSLPPPPRTCDYGTKVSRWPLMANDRLGDCTCAAAGHVIQEWTANAGSAVVPSDDDVIAMYQAVSGYDPKTGANDNGAYEIDVLNRWRKVGLAGHKLFGFAGVEASNFDLVRTAIYLFGAVYLGLALPLTAQSQSVWAVASTTGQGRPGSWGGHAVPIIAYDAQSFTCITWGGEKRMTDAFLATYCDEAYALLGTDWMMRGQTKAPNGFDFQSLELDIDQFGGVVG